MTKAKKEKSGKSPGDKGVDPVTEPETPAQPTVETPPDSASAPEDRLLRLQADFDNYRKRTIREKTEWQWKANEALLLELLPVLDHFELGLNTASKQHANAAVVDGFRMVYDQLGNALGKFQVTPVEAEGKSFDPNWHEAITYVPSEEHPAGFIIAETRRGYRIGEKLLRASQVVVSSGPAETEEAADDKPEELDN